MDDTLVLLLENLAALGQSNDALETARARRMLNITRDTGRLLWILVRSARARRILEIGTSNAFSTIWLADAARAVGGRVTTLEVDETKIKLAQTNLALAGLDGCVDIVQGHAADTLAALQGLFDLVFLDADRSNYVTYLELVLPKLQSGGLLIADNAGSHAHELAEYVRRVESHPELFAVMVPIGNGEEIAFKR